MTALPYVPPREVKYEMTPEIFDATVDAEYTDLYDDESWTDDDSDYDFEELAEVLQDALSDDYSDAEPEDIDNALGEVLDSMSAAEAFNFAKALKQVSRTAGKVVADPMFRKVVGTALPTATGALGTLLGGPAGTALGSRLGSAAAGALAGGRGAARPVPRIQAIPALAGAAPSVAGGSAAAAQGLVLTQQPDVLKSLLALSLGQDGKKAVNGVPVASVMNMLSSIFGQAAADADELMYLGDAESFAESDEFSYQAEADEPVTGRELYTSLLDADNAELAEAVESV